MSSYISRSQLSLPRPQKVSYTQSRQPLETVKPMDDMIQFSGKIGHKKIRRYSLISALAFAIPLGTATTWAETTAQVSPTGLVYHYVTGNGQPKQLDFAELDLTGIQSSPYFPNLQEIANSMKKQGIERQPIDYAFGYRLREGDEFSVGGLQVRLKGVMIVKGSRWKLQEGELTGEPNKYEYHPANGRSVMGNVTTWLGGELLPGKPYMLIFKGSQSFQASGEC